MRKMVERLQASAVDCAAEHFELRFDSGDDASVLVALLGRPKAGLMSVELLVPRDIVNACAIGSIEKEIEFYFFQLNERDPWGYAQYHCGSAANVYSKVHWNFVKGSTIRQPAVLTEVILEVGGEGGSITLLREKTADGKERFRLTTNESALDDEGEESDTGTAVRVDAASFRGGLTLLDKYPWTRLHPLEMHTRYRKRILREVEKRGGPDVMLEWSKSRALEA